MNRWNSTDASGENSYIVPKAKEFAQISLGVAAERKTPRYIFWEIAE
jgi:hypothetical protein